MTANVAPASDAHEQRRLKLVGFYAVVLLTFVLAYRIVAPFLLEIGWAAVLAVCLAPVQGHWSRHLGRARSATYLTVLVLLTLVAPLLLVAYTLMNESAQFVAYVKGHLADPTGPMAFFHSAWQRLHDSISFVPTEQEMVQRLSNQLAVEAPAQAGHVVVQAVNLVFSQTIILCLLFFMLRDGQQLAHEVHKLLPFGRERNAQLLALIHDIVLTSVSSTLVIALIQGVLGGLTYLLLGVPGWLFWGCVTAIAALLPAVGATLVWLPAAFWLAVSGSWMKGVALALVGLLVLSNVDNVVRPIMLKGRSRMSTLIVIISLLGGVSAFGFIGIVLGPVVAAVLTAFFKTYVLVHEVAAEARTSEADTKV